MTDNKQRIKLNPNDLVIDMTLDDDNVAVKIESMKRSGMTQDVYVWKQGHRIIDGFHRTAAACGLGWDTIDVVVVDCSEEQFWDSRIQSAKQHHKVSEARFSDWVIESWNNSEMCEIAKSEMKANVSRKDLELLKKLAQIGRAHV